METPSDTHTQHLNSYFLVFLPCRKIPVEEELNFLILSHLQSWPGVSGNSAHLLSVRLSFDLFSWCTVTIS